MAINPKVMGAIVGNQADNAIMNAERIGEISQMAKNNEKQIRQLTRITGQIGVSVQSNTKQLGIILEKMDAIIKQVRDYGEYIDAHRQEHLAELRKKNSELEEEIEGGRRAKQTIVYKVVGTVAGTILMAILGALVYLVGNADKIIDAIKVSNGH